MMINLKELMDNFKNVTMGVISENAGSNAVGVVKGIASAMEKTLKAIDRYLSMGADKAKDLVEQGKTTANKFKERSKTTVSELREDFKSKGAKGVIKDTVGGTKQFIGNIFKSKKEPESEDPNNNQSQTIPLPKKKGAIESLKDFIKKPTIKNDQITAKEQSQKNETINTPVKRISLQSLKEKGRTLKNGALNKVQSLNLKKQKGFVNSFSDDKDEPIFTDSDASNINLPDPSLYSIIEKITDKIKDTYNDIKDFRLSDKDKAKEDIDKDKDIEDPKLTLDKIKEDKDKKSILELMKDVLDKVKESVSSIGDKDQKEPDAKEKARLERKKESEEAYALQKQRDEKRDKEVEDEKNASKVKPKDKKDSGGIFGAILAAIGGITSAIGMVTKAITSASSSLLWGLAKLMPGALWKVMKYLPRMIGGALSAVMGSGKIAGAIGAGAKFLGSKLLLPAAKAAGSLALKAGAAIGGALAFKVVLAGAAIYGGYKLYKYLTRNNLGSGVQGTMTRLRMLSYGFSDVNRDHYHKLLELDMLMKDYVSNKDGRADYKQFDKDFKEKVLGIFNVSREETEKYTLLNTWFIKRYTPAHAAFMHAYYGSGGADYLDNLEKLSGNQTFNFATTYSLPTSVYDFKKIPVFESPDSTVSKAEIDTILTELRQSAKKDSDQYKGKSAEQVQKETQKKAAEEAAAKRAQSDKLTENSKAATEKANAESSKPPTNDTKDKPQTTSGPLNEQVQKASNTGATPEQKPSVDNSQSNGPTTQVRAMLAKKKQGEGQVPHAEGEGKPNVSNAGSTSKEEKPLSGSIDKVAKAPGPLTTGNQSLEGIKSNVPTEKIHNLDPNVFNLFTGMAKEYKDLTGKNILVTEAFRTSADQAALKQKYGDRAAKPGTSLHEFGLAVDINTPDADALDKMGLMRKYGFTRPIGGETWHLEPAGVATEPQKSKSDPGLRQQLVTASPGRGGGGLGLKPTPPPGLKYKRDIPLQKAIFNSGPTVETVVSTDKAKDSTNSVPAPSIDNIKPQQGVEQTSGGKGGLVTGDGSPVRSSDGAPVSTGYSETQNTQNNKPVTTDTKPGAIGSGSKNTSITSNIPATKDSGPIGIEADSPKPKITSSIPVSPTAPKGLDSKPAENVTTSQPNLNPGEFVNLEPKQAVVQASKVVGMDPNTMLAFAQVESSMRPSDKNPNSSAKGLFQITGDTWKYLLGKYGPKYNMPPDADINNSYYNSLLGVSYAKENLGLIKGHKEANIRDDTALYLAHHFGPTGANNIIKGVEGNPETPIQSVVTPAAYKANSRELQGKTTSQYISYLNDKLAKAGSAAGATTVAQNTQQPNQQASSANPQTQGGQQVAMNSKPSQNYNNGSSYGQGQTSGGANSPPVQVASADPNAALYKPGSVIPKREYSTDNNNTQYQSKQAVWTDEDEDDYFYEKANRGIYNTEPPGPPPTSTATPGYSPQYPTTTQTRYPTQTTNPIEQVASRAGNVVTNTVQQNVNSIGQAITRPINDISSTIQRGVRDVTSSVTSPIANASSALQRQIGSIGGSIAGIGGYQSNPMTQPPMQQPRPGFVDLSKPESRPVSISGASPQQNYPATMQPPQPSQALSLDKTESLLSSMGDTLSQIKGILQAIHDKPSGGMGGDSSQPQAQQPAQQQADSGQPQQSQTPIKAPVDKTSSFSSVSMSRKSVLA